MEITEIEFAHEAYKKNKLQWAFFLRSYEGGEEYGEGKYLARYLNEDEEEYLRRIELTPLDNHCSNIIHIYSSFLWRVPPTRVLNSLDKDPSVERFLKDADHDGRSLNAFMSEAQVWSSVYGHVWLMVDKPVSTAGTKADELDQDIRPYVTMYTPENVLDWEYERTASGRFVLKYFKVIEDEQGDSIYYRVWTKDTVESWKVTGGKVENLSSEKNTLGKITAVFLPSKRSTVRGIGVSDLANVAYMQKAIYQELSEIEQLIRLSNHPTLVKSTGTDASAGAGSIINVPDDLDTAMKPFMLQPDGANLDAVRAVIEDKVKSINRMAHMGAVRGTDAVTMSGVAMQTEFQMLNAKLSEKANILELVEEHVWQFFCEFQGVSPDVEVFYPDSFDLRDVDKELVFLQQIRATGVKSKTLSTEIDKRIADLLLDDDTLASAHKEIDASSMTIGQFPPEPEEIGII